MFGGFGGGGGGGFGGFGGAPTTTTMTTTTTPTVIGAFGSSAPTGGGFAGAPAGGGGGMGGFGGGAAMGGFGGAPTGAAMGGLGGAPAAMGGFGGAPTGPAIGGFGGASTTMGGFGGGAAMSGGMGGMGGMGAMGMGQMGGQMGGGGAPDLITCSGCGQLVADNNYLTAFRLYWHPTHLMCASCKKDFSDGRKIEEGADGFAYCSPCLVEKFAPRCGKCSEVLKGPFINALGKAFHSQCFVCTKCSQPFTGNFYPNDKGEVFCEQDFYKVQGLWCSGCDGPIITGRLVSMGERKFHPDHFLCAQCRTKLTGKKYFEVKTKPYCESCNLALFE
jgi:uncharacterized CHY-type Zn-finger protein